MDIELIAEKLKKEDLKGFFNKIFELSFLSFSDYANAGGARCISVKSKLVNNVYSSVELSPYDIDIKVLGELPENHKQVVDKKGVDKDGGLSHLQGKALYDEFFKLMLKKAYELGVFEEYKKGLVQYWTKKLTENHANIIELLEKSSNSPVASAQIEKTLQSVKKLDWVKEFKAYIKELVKI